MTGDGSTLQAIALNRFGLGAKPGEVLPSDPAAYLLAQLAPAAADGTIVFPDARETGRIFVQYETARKAVRTGAPPSDTRKIVAGKYDQDVALRFKSALTTKAPFRERLVHFWSNHFAISTDKPQVTVLAGDFEQTAIRPHVAGKFEDMLVAVEQHPAMQIYLDQRRSIGPNSLVAKASADNPEAKKRGINENLAREILELHTLGVRSGYDQKDVIQFALAMTGWSVGVDPEKETIAFAFHPRQHEPGPKTVLGKTYAEDGYPQALAVMKDLAKADATALHISTKLARHFIADDPPPEAVESLRKAYLESGGDLPHVYRALIQDPAAWGEQRVKFKTPWEWLVSMLRASGQDSFEKLEPAHMFRQLGQPIWQPKSPAGYDDVADSWAAPDALVRRVELAQRVLALLPDHGRPQQLMQKLALGPLAANTVKQVDSAETIDSGLTLLYMSPEFLRR